MTIAELGSLGEFIAAIATLGTLIYLTLQVRQNTESTRISASQAILDSLNEALSAAASTPQAARTVVLGQTDYENLSEEEQAQFLVWIFSWFRVVEQAHFFHEKGYLENELWVGHVEHLKQLIRTPAVSGWWEFRCFFFSDSFRQLVENAKIGDAKAQPIKEFMAQISLGVPR